MSLRLGYHGINHDLKEQGIYADRTLKHEYMKNINNHDYIRENYADVIQHLMEISMKNVQDLYKIIEWNVANGVKFYRCSSHICPFICSDHLCNMHNAGGHRHTPKGATLAYDISPLRPWFEKIGKLARDNDMRLTFHPDPFCVLNSTEGRAMRYAQRDLYYHSLMLQYMRAPLDSFVVLHGGGAYGDKDASIKRWIKNFKELPRGIAQYICVENDEKTYNIDDVLQIGKACNIPVVLDLFHFEIYATNPKKTDAPKQPVEWYINHLVDYHKALGRQMKVHVSCQNKTSKKVGEHSEFIYDLSNVLKVLEVVKKRKVRIDLMIEAKMTNVAYMDLKEKLKNKI